MASVERWTLSVRPAEVSAWGEPQGLGAGEGLGAGLGKRSGRGGGQGGVNKDGTRLAQQDSRAQVGCLLGKGRGEEAQPKPKP